MNKDISYIKGICHVTIFAFNMKLVLRDFNAQVNKLNIYNALL